MTGFENIERISISGAYGFNALAKMYIISDDEDLCERVRSEIIEHFNPGKYAAPFSFELVNHFTEIPDTSVAIVVRQRDYLAIVQVPDAEEPTFVACKRDGDSFQDFLSIINLFSTVEKEFKASFQDVILEYAQKRPSKIKDFLQYITGTVLASIAEPCMMAPIFPAGRISFGGRKEKDAKNSKISKETLEEAKKDFVDNVLKYQSGDVNALSKIEMVINSMSDSEKNKILSDYIKSMAEDGVTTFHRKYIDTNNILNLSQVFVCVQRFKTCSGNDGYFRISLKYKENELKQIEFKHKETCVIFLMHLLYNRQNGDVRKNMILNSNNQMPFIHIFMKVYDITEQEAISRYKNLQDEYDDVSNKLVAQGRLKDFISDLNKSVESLILPLDESPYPLKIKRNGYMPILNSKVYFDEDSLRELQTTIV